MQHLLDTGNYDITVFDIREFGDSRVKCIVGDLRVVDDVNRACAGKPICNNFGVLDYAQTAGSIYPA